MLAEEEFTRFADLVASLTPEEWATPTDAPDGTFARWCCTSSVQAKPKRPSESSSTS